jgi:Tfp pilus assembly protein PilF
MPEPEPPDTHHLQAALGWLELGNQREANSELDKISAPFQVHPTILELRWTIHAATENWEAALRVAQTSVDHYPDNPTSWINRAFAARRVKGGSLQRAWDALYPAAAMFPKEPTIPYNLACYACQSGRTDEGWDWLRIAVRAARSPDQIKQRALKDPDLKPLWSRIINI